MLGWYESSFATNSYTSFQLHSRAEGVGRENNIDWFQMNTIRTALLRSLQYSPRMSIIIQHS